MWIKTFILNILSIALVTLVNKFDFKSAFVASVDMQATDKVIN